MKINFLDMGMMSRKQIKNEAEKVCRIINSEFPVISATKISEFDNTRNNPKFKLFTQEIQKRITDKVRDPMWPYRGDGQELELFKILIEKVKEFRVANCGDLSKLCKLICNINNIPTRKAEMIFSQDGILKGRIDHAIQILPFTDEQLKFAPLSKLKDVLIIDPWLGFAEFAPKAGEMFQKEYGRFFGLEEGNIIHLDPLNNMEPHVTKEVIEYFRRHFPQFIINKNKPLINHNK